MMHLNSNFTLMKGIDAQNNGRFEEAKKLYKLVLLSEPNNSDAHHNLGIISLIYSKHFHFMGLLKIFYASSLSFDFE